MLVEEDNYRGYVIPSGSTIIPNVWCILALLTKDLGNLSVFIPGPQGDDTQRNHVPVTECI